MTVGPLARAELVRAERVHSGTRGRLVQPSSLSASLPSSPQLGHILGSGTFAAASSSPDSSRDVSPARFVRQTSGPSPEWQPNAHGSEIECPNLEIASLESTILSLKSELTQMPSFGYERGQRALWLDRHPSWQGSSQYSLKEDDEAGSAKGVSARRSSGDIGMIERSTDSSSSAAAASRRGGSPLDYCPSWRISKSPVWSLAELSVRSTLQPPPSALLGDPSQLPPSQPATPTAESLCASPRTALAVSAAAAASAAADAAACALHDASKAPSDPTTTNATAALPDGLMSRWSARPSGVESLPLPYGLGPVGLSSPTSPTPSPTRRLRRAVLCLLAKGRMDLKKGMQRAAAEDEEEEEEGHLHDTDAVLAAVRVGSPGAHCNGLRRNGSLQFAQMVSEAVAEAVAASPASRAVVRRRVRALVAGLSVAYAAANLGGCAAALMHADFSHDFANSAKAVLDFLFTVPTVTGIASDLLQIGVAVGLGMAQRRPPPC